MLEPLTNRLLAKLDQHAGMTIQTLCQLLVEPIASITHELSTMENGGMIQRKSGQIFLTVYGTRMKNEMSTTARSY
ncbi:MAG: hypothetical protein A2751_03355 [Candidatus Doudnabacteria bacterium RIFCSPHIGHO2_01_FULL_46_14]|uniref:HTH arsR-type domain-containing protein n=1 Tax=Candidatus Doudnabacteria bacterium RIFCSPHIGHO2_01_FULL_46_14 TaxID=1817824 RepID=A0A1F5NKE1_9BACT|nr:MAG: hypothetical protein A2751_03355 [Candidatus Doudnabacteria bacterium RIFCSPHIGHO2_01_FULL_46_14]